MGVALKCSECGAGSVSSLFYVGPDAHACRLCGAAFELANPANDRREADRREHEADGADWAEWRSGEDRRRAASLDPKRRHSTPSAG